LCVHQGCYAIETIPEGEWFCEPCSENVNNVRCCVCPNEDDKAFKKTAEGTWIHLNCALWIPETIFAQPLCSPVRDVACIDPRRFNLVCFVPKMGLSSCFRIVPFAGRRVVLVFNAASPIVSCRFMVTSASLHVSHCFPVPCAIRSGFRCEMREKISAGDQDQVFFHVFCPKHFSEAVRVDSVNSLGLDFMKRRKRKLSGELETLPGSSKRPAKTRLLLLPTKLDASQKQELEKFCRYFQASMKQAFSNSVTHIITNCTKRSGAHLKNRTTKLQFGIVTGKWIMCFDCEPVFVLQFVVTLFRDY
jgi:hypothetical protein